MNKFEENIRKHNLIKIYLSNLGLQMVNMVVVDDSVRGEIADFYFSLWESKPLKEYFHIPSICRKEELVFTEIEDDFLKENPIISDWVNYKRRDYIDSQKNELEDIFRWAKNKFDLRG